MKVATVLMTYLTVFISVSFAPSGGGQTVAANCCPKAQYVTPITPTFADSVARVKREREMLARDSEAKRKQIDKILKKSEK